MIVWAVLRNPMIHESAATTVSLHKTKVGAWRAKHRLMFDLTVAERDQAIAWGGRWAMGRKPLEFQAFGIEPIEVHE